MVRFDPYSYEHHEDPYPTYRQLRDESPAYLDPERGFWALSRHDDVRAAIDDWPTYSSTGGITLERRTENVEPMLIEMDPPRHTELRALVSRAFTPRRVADLEAPIGDLARELSDGFAPGDRVDVIEDFAAKLPMAVISVMLGVPRDDQDELRSWSDAMLHREEGSAEITPAGIDGAIRLYGYFNDAIANRRRTPSEDLVGALVAAQEGDRSLSPEEVLGFCFLLLIAGNETTTKLIGNALFWLASFPDQRARLLEAPSLIPGAVEETLRFDTSTQALARVLTRDVELHGTTLPAGAKGLLLFGSANRDERRWDEPDRFDIGRNPAGHLAFGHGLHHCLGAPLARLETRVALDVLLPRLGEYRVDADDAVRVHSGNVRGFARLPIEVGVMTKKHLRIGKDPERLNRTFWDGDADDYQAAHDSQLDSAEMGWGVWHIPEAEIGVLGDVSGLDVLEFGCGAAQWAIKLARAGARVTGLDQSRGQLRHAAEKIASADLSVPLVCASGTAVPLPDASFDVVFCDHGAMSFCDPYRTVPEVARVLRTGGRFAFNISTLLRNLCYPVGDPDAPVSRKLHGRYFGARAFDWGDGTIDYQIPHGEWIALFRDHDLVVEDLFELRPPKRATSTYGDYVDHDWARRWPAEEIWKVRKL